VAGFGFSTQNYVKNDFCFPERKIVKMQICVIVSKFSHCTNQTFSFFSNNKKWSVKTKCLDSFILARNLKSDNYCKFSFPINLQKCVFDFPLIINSYIFLQLFILLILNSIMTFLISFKNDLYIFWNYSIWKGICVGRTYFHNIIWKKI